MASSVILEALVAVGDRLAEAVAGPARGPAHGPMHAPTPSTAKTDLHTITLLVVGGAAGMLTGLLDADRTTTDCDVMLYDPPGARELVDSIAAEVAADLGLSERWLNSGGMPWADAMPGGWKDRLETVLVRGPLIVRAVSRLDLIALKLMAGRPQDIEDLETMAMNADEIAVLRAHFAAWSDDSWPAGAIANAVELLETLARDGGELGGGS